MKTVNTQLLSILFGKATKKKKKLYMQSAKKHKALLQQPYKKNMKGMHIRHYI